MNRFPKYIAVIMTFMSIILIACSDQGTSEDIGSEAAISECGGFANTQAKIIADENSPGALECGDETLQWQYDSETDQVKLVNDFVWLNCCGDHSIKAIYDEEINRYEIREKDQPVDGDARCGCMCTFDFSIDIPAFGVEKINLLLTREITDDEGGASEIYNGELNLSEGSGKIIITENVGYCE